MWQWWSFFLQSMPHGKQPLRINLDESALCVHQRSPRGFICFSGRRARELMQSVPRSRTRQYITFVCVICDNAVLQPLMPQFLIGNEHTFRQRDMAELHRSLPSNVYILRRKSSWNNQTVMSQILRTLRSSIAPYLDGLQPIIFWDAANQHIAPSVHACAKRLGVWPITIPAKLTWLLQPLDTHAFALFKHKLEDLHHSERVRSGNGDVAFVVFMDCMYTAIREIVSSRSWHAAFDSNGFSVPCGQVSRRVMKELEIGAPLDIPQGRPALDDVACCFPKRYKVTEAIAFGVASPPTPAAIRPVGGGIASAGALASASHLGRTRSETRSYWLPRGAPLHPLLARSASFLVSVSRLCFICNACAGRGKIKSYQSDDDLRMEMLISRPIRKRIEQVFPFVVHKQLSTLRSCLLSMDKWCNGFTEFVENTISHMSLDLVVHVCSAVRTFPLPPIFACSCATRLLFAGALAW